MLRCIVLRFAKENEKVTRSALDHSTRYGYVRLRVVPNPGGGALGTKVPPRWSTEANRILTIPIARCDGVIFTEPGEEGLGDEAGPYNDERIPRDLEKLAVVPWHSYQSIL